MERETFASILNGLFFSDEKLSKNLFGTFLTVKLESVFEEKKISRIQNKVCLKRSRKVS